MTREEMIRRLVAYSVEEAVREPQSYWLQELFEKGFSGYRKFSSSKLRRELELRGLDTLEEEYDDADGEDYTPDDIADSLTGLAGDGRQMD
ncbi:MAG: hypothetical protein ACT4P8_04340 [Betaproteobacteria bacterium]